MATRLGRYLDACGRLHVHCLVSSALLRDILVEGSTTGELGLRIESFLSIIEESMDEYDNANAARPRDLSAPETAH